MTQPSPEAIAGAKAAQAKWRVPASISLGQWALESGWGAHMPPASMNPFGIIALPGQPAVSVPTREVDKYGHAYTTTRPFRKFATIAEAFDLHAKLLATSGYYAAAMKALPDLKAFIHLMAPHYATDPRYEALLNAVIRGSNLTQYDGAKP